MQPLQYSKFSLYQIDPHDLEAIQPGPFPFCEGAVSRMVGVGIDEPACQVVFEDFFPGPEYVWTTWQDQIDFVIEGRAQITYFEPPDQDIKHTVTVGPGCIYLIPRGTKIFWKVLGEGVFRHISIDFPNPGFTSDLAKSVRNSA
jgi:hypothetical protein